MKKIPNRLWDAVAAVLKMKHPSVANCCVNGVSATKLIASMSSPLHRSGQIKERGEKRWKTGTLIAHVDTEKNHP